MLVSLPADFIPLGMAYDWIAEVLYLAGNRSQQLELWTVSVGVPTSRLNKIHSFGIGGPLPGDLEMGITMNPFTGLV